MSKGDKLQVSLVGGPPWGFRLGGGSDFGCPLEIAKLRKRSKAFEAGLAEGDVVTVIDHQDVTSKSHGDAMKIIELAGPTLTLSIIKGVGPSADFAAMQQAQLPQQTVRMQQPPQEEQQIPQQQLIQHQQQVSQQPPNRHPPPTQPKPQSNGYEESMARSIEAMVVRSREPSISRSYIETTRSREPSISRTLHVITHNHKQPENSVKPLPVHKPDPWTVDVTSYQFNGGTSLRQPPPISPKPKFKATTLPRGGGSSAAPVQHAQPAPMFKVAKIQSRAPDRWQPSTPVSSNEAMHNQRPDQPISSQPRSYQPAFQSFSPQQPQQQNYHSPQPQGFQSPQLQSFQSQQSQSFEPQQLQSFQGQEPPSFQPQQTQSFQSQQLVSPQPSYAPQSPAQSEVTEADSIQVSPRRKGHIPGMLNPLICDDSQGDFGANPIVQPDKKLYSDSAFYDAPGMKYPTINDQVALCKEIANLLDSNQNKRSRGGRMFNKRKQRAEEWSMASQGQRRETNPTGGSMYDDPTYYSAPPPRKEFGYNQVRHHPDPIKAKLSMEELERLQHDQSSLCKHDELPPNMAFDVNAALSHSHGKAGQIFARRKARAEKYTVDESNVKQYVDPPTLLQAPLTQPLYTRQYTSPWEAAASGQLDLAFTDFNGNTPSVHSDQSQPAYSKISYSDTRSMTSAPEPKLDVNFKSFRPVQYTPGSQVVGGLSGSQTLPRRRTRLEEMLEGGGTSSLTFNMGQSNPLSPNVYNQSSQQSGYSQPYQPTYAEPGPMSSGPDFSTQQPRSNTLVSGFTANLRRPKDYMQQQPQSRGPAAVSAF